MLLNDAFCTCAAHAQVPTRHHDNRQILLEADFAEPPLVGLGRGDCRVAWKLGPLLRQLLTVTLHDVDPVAIHHLHSLRGLRRCDEFAFVDHAERISRHALPHCKRVEYLMQRRRLFYRVVNFMRTTFENQCFRIRCVLRQGNDEPWGRKVEARTSRCAPCVRRDGGRDPPATCCSCVFWIFFPVVGPWSWVFGSFFVRRCGWFLVLYLWFIFRP